MTPLALLVNMLTGTGSKIIIIFLTVTLIIWVLYTMYETSLRIKATKQTIVLNDIAIAQQTV